MKKRILALLLAVALLLTGCGVVDFSGYWNGIRQMLSGGWVDYNDMVYERPDAEAFQAVLEESCRVAAEGESLDAVIDQLWAFYDVYDQAGTMLRLAEIRYCGDLTDTYWQAEYEYCMEFSNTVSAAMDTYYRALADSPYRADLEGDDYFGEGFFDAYEGESIWDDTFQALMTQQSQLESQYYDLSNQSAGVTDAEQFYEEYGTQLVQLYVELVDLRQQIADYAGYDSYPEFAYDWYYYRDYTPEQAMELLDQISEELTPLYRDVSTGDFWMQDFGSCSPAQALSYVRDTVDAMGGTPQDALEILEKYHLYDIDYGVNKFDSSFETFLPSYGEPFVFLNPSGSTYDCLSLAHEFGHFCADYASYGSVAGIDVMEMFSQGMEYLSLCYGDTPELLTQMKLADCLDVYVEQAAWADFEHQVYGLTGADLTAERVEALFGQIAAQYGMDLWEVDNRAFVTVPHFFTEPMYVVSYVVSNDAAFQLYQLEQSESGAGLAAFEENLDTSAESFLMFLEEAGLESPFAPGRISKVAQTLTDILA